MDIEKLKKKYLESLKLFHGNKIKAAKELGIDLQSVRALRHKDPEFNVQYKNLAINKNVSPNQENLKDSLLRLLSEGLSQKEACRKLNISLILLRTWKKQDTIFKKKVLGFLD